MTASGRGAATSVTKSHSPRSQTPSMTRSQIARTWSSMARTRRGVKPADTRRRRRTCSGASKSIIMAKGPNLGRMPPALEKVAVSVATALMSR